MPAPSAWDEVRRQAGPVTAAALVASLGLCLAGMYPVWTPDTFGHLAQGRQIVELGRVPTHDSFSLVGDSSSPWHNYEWLSDLIGYAVFQALGYDGLVGLKCATLGLAGALLVLLAFRFGGVRAAWVCALLLVLAIPGARFRFSARPHLVALPLSALYLLACSHLAVRRSRLHTGLCLSGLFAAHVLWVNLHGSHLLGLLITATFVVLGPRDGSARRVLLAALGLQAIASCISPFGPRIVLDAIDHVLDPAYRALVTEWEPWQPDDPLWFLLAPVLNTLLLVAVTRPLLRAGGAARALLLIASVMALAALRSVRFVGDYLVLSAPILSIGLASPCRAWSGRAFRGAVVACLLVLVVMVPPSAAALPPHLGFGAGASRARLPVASAAWLAENARAPRIYAAIDDSWFMMFAVPRGRFLVDGRVPFYGPEHMARLRAATMDARAFGTLLDEYGVDTVVVRYPYRAHAVVAAAMRDRPGWTLAMIEDRYGLYVREGLLLRPNGRLSPVALQAGYEPTWLLGADDGTARRTLAALARLPAVESTAGLRAWIRGLLALRPFMRPGLGNGIRPPTTPEERARAAPQCARARRALRGCSRALPARWNRFRSCTPITASWRPPLASSTWQSGPWRGRWSRAKPGR